MKLQQPLYPQEGATSNKIVVLRDKNNERVPLIFLSKRKEGFLYRNIHHSTSRGKQDADQYTKTSASRRIT